MKKIISIIAALSSLSAVACGGGDTVSRVSSEVESGGAYNEDTSGNGTTNEDGTTTPSTNDSAGSTNEGGSEPVVEEVILEDELKISDKTILNNLLYSTSEDQTNKSCYIINVKYHTTNLFLDNKDDTRYGPSINDCEMVVEQVGTTISNVFVLYCKKMFTFIPDSTNRISINTDNNAFIGSCRWQEKGAYCCMASKN